MGEALVDVIAGELVPGTTRHEPVRLRAGGTAVNAALAAAASGARVAVVARVGDDAAATVISSALEAAGVEPLLAVDPALPTGTFIEAWVDGERAVASDRGATDALAAADLPAVGGGAVLVSGYLLFHERTHAVARAALRSFGAAVAGITGGSATAADRGRLAGVGVLVVNAAEALALTGRSGEAAALELAGDVGIACVTLGAEGAVAARGTRVERVAGVERGDPLGAGDAFAGRLLVALGRGDELASALERAAA